MNKTGDWATQVKQRVHFDRGLGRAKIRPRKQREAQINGRAVERINRIGQIKAERVTGSRNPMPYSFDGCAPRLASISRKLSRYVICAKAMMRNCFVQRSDRT